MSHASLHRLATAATLACVVAACESVDPRQELEVQELEAYWVVDTPRGETQYLAPLVRFRLRNHGAKRLRSIQATATFRRKGEESQSWGSAFAQVTPAAKPLGPGQESSVELRSDGRYSSTGPPESMFAHKLFKDAKVEVFVRIGPSAWTKLAESGVERRIGSRNAEALLR